MNTVANPLKGECVVNLGGKPRMIKMNMNAFRLVAKKMGKKLGEVLDEFSKASGIDQIEIFTEFVKAGFINNLHYEGESTAEYSDELLDAWVGEMTGDDYQLVMEAFTHAISLGKTKAQEEVKGQQ